MAGGKLTPRQQMINMMYLVLTAMLALNVSVEVLDAFVLIDKSLNQSITTVREKNINELNDFAKAAAENPEKVIRWKTMADEVHIKAEELYNYLHHLKIEVIRAADGEKALALADTVLLDISAVDAKDNTDAGTRILLGANHDGKAYTLREKFEEYRTYLLGLIAKETITARSIEELLQTKDPSMLSDGTNLTWETSQFESTPVVSDIALLSKMQLDVLNSESEVLIYLRNQIDAADFKFSTIEVAAIPEAKYVIQGTKYNTEVFLAAYDPTLTPTLYVGGRAYHPKSDGKISYEYQTNALGPQNISGYVEFLGPDGQQTTRPVNFQFQVAAPNVVVSPTKMNVVYRGIDNPLSISLSGITADKLDPRATNGQITKKDGEYYLRPGDGRTSEVLIYYDGKNMGGPTFRVKDLPIPTPALDGITSKIAAKGDLLASQGMLAEMKDFDFDLKYRITSFTASVTIDGYLDEKKSDSQLFTDEQKTLFNRVRSGQRVAFTDIKAIGPDGRTVELLDLSIRIR